jgi:hypothetical protein
MRLVRGVDSSSKKGLWELTGQLVLAGRKVRGVACEVLPPSVLDADLGLLGRGPGRSRARPGKGFRVEGGWVWWWW